MHDAVIYADALTKRYGKTVAVDTITLHVGRGEIFGFLGLNGAGKTTIIRTLLGMVRPTSGRAYLFGNEVDPDNHSLWRRVGYMVETPYAYPDLTVRENLRIIAMLRGLQDRRAVDKVMDRLSLTKYASRKAKHLSLGNAQRLGIAKALIHEPDLLILDEPANGLDPAGIVEIRNLLHDLAHVHGVTIFTSSHILGEISQLATNIGIVHEGKLLQEVAASDLAKATKKRLHVLTRDNVAAAALLKKQGYITEHGEKGIYLSSAEAVDHPDTIATKLVRENIPPTLLHVETESLEDYFLRIIAMASKEG